MRMRTEQKREDIVVAATELFAQKGYQDVSMELVAKVAKCSKPTLYSYFSSKKVLFEVAMSGQPWDSIEYSKATGKSPIPIVPIGHYNEMVAIINLMKQSTDDVRTTLYEFGKNFMTTMCKPEYVEIFRIAVGASGRTDIGNRFYESGLLHAVQHMRDFLKLRAETGELSVEDPRMAAFHYYGLIRSSIFDPYLFGYSKPLKNSQIAERVRIAVDAFMKIYGKE